MFADLGLGFDPELSRFDTEVRSAVAQRVSELRADRAEVLISNLAVAIAERVGELFGG